MTVALTEPNTPSDLAGRLVRRLRAFRIATRREAGEWVRAALRSVPGELGCILRRRFYGFRSGPDSRVLSDVVIHYPENLVLGANVGIASHCQINASARVVIGDDALIGPGALIWSQNHRYLDPATPIHQQGYDKEPVSIGRDAWIGAGSVILPGVSIADGTVVAAGAVVTRSTEPYSVVAGVPARLVKRRSSPAEVSDVEPGGGPTSATLEWNVAPTRRDGVRDGVALTDRRVEPETTRR